MKRSIVFILTLPLLLIFTYCTIFYTKDNYLKDFDQFITNAEMNYSDYTSQDWENSDMEYDQFSSELYQKVYSELTQGDQKKIGKLKARYQKIKLKSEINSTIQSIKDGINQTVGALEDVIDSTTNK